MWVLSKSFKKGRGSITNSIAVEKKKGRRSSSKVVFDNPLYSSKNSLSLEQPCKVTFLKVEQIKEVLENSFDIKYLSIDDESHRHRKKDTHFKIVIVSDDFLGVPILKRHRILYQALSSISYEAVSLHPLDDVAEIKKYKGSACYASYYRGCG